jgi:type I restriction enzyme S subunit
MNKVERLISELCPDGVIHVSLGEIVEVLNGYSFKSSKYTDSGVRILRISNVQKGKIVDADPKFYPLSSIDEIERYMLEEGDLLVSLTGNVGRVGQIPSSLLPAGLNQRVACLRMRDTGKISLRYLYYLLDDSKFEKDCLLAANGSAQANLSTEWLKGYFVSLPPLQVQDEIVRILDTFTELDAELKAELEARKTQYEFYRESLFNTHNSTQKSLESVASIWRGRRFVKDHIRSEGVPAIHYGEIYTKYGLAATEAYSFLDPEFASKLRFVSPGDVVLVSAGETIEDIGKSFTWLGAGDAVIHDACYGIRSSEIDPRYMVHFFNTHNFRSQLRKYISSSKISAISTEKLGKVFIPVPSPEEQKAIADVLDLIDCLVSDLSVGLPGEIAARRRQYEYFRGKLLSFKELEVA